MRDIHGDVVYGDKVNGNKIVESGGGHTVHVTGAPTVPQMRREKLRILYLTAAPVGDLRVDQEVRRVLLGIRQATHRDAVQVEHVPAATGEDLLDGLTRFGPHVVQFSRHGNAATLAFDSGNPGQAADRPIAVGLVARALAAVDTPPLLAVLNSCQSAAPLRQLLRAVPFAVGMSDRVLDNEALTFAARFYQSVADGTSVGSAYRMAKVHLDMLGQRADLPVLCHRPGVDPDTVKLVDPDH